MDIPEFFVDRYLERAELSVELVHACIHRGHLRRSVSYVAAAAAQAAAVAAIHRDVTLKAAVTCSLQRAGQLVQVTAPLSGALCSASFASSGWTPNETGGVPTELSWLHAPSSRPRTAPDAPTPSPAAEIVAPGAPPRGSEPTEHDDEARAAPTERGWTSPSPNEAGGVPTELSWPHVPSRRPGTVPDAPTPSPAAEIVAPGAPPRGSEPTERDEARAAPTERGWTSPSPTEASGVPTELSWPHASSRDPRAAPDAPTPSFAAEIVTPGAPPHGSEPTERGE